MTRLFNTPRHRAMSNFINALDTYGTAHVFYPVLLAMDTAHVLCSVLVLP